MRKKIYNAGDTVHCPKSEFGENLRIPEDYYSDLLLRGYNPGTLTKHRKDLRLLIYFLQARKVRNFNEVSREDLKAYQFDMTNRQLSPYTIIGRLVVVRHFFNYLEEKMIIFDNPCEVLKNPKESKMLPKVISEKEVGDLLDSVNGSDPRKVRDRCMLEVLYSTGVRQGELGGLTVDDIDSIQGIMRVFGKKQKERIVPIGDTALKWLKRYMKSARPYFLERCSETTSCLWLNQQGTPYRADKISRMVNEYAKKAGITSRVSCHTLRRSCATHLLQNGASPAMVAELLGHVSLNTLKHYLKLEIEDLKKAHSKTGAGQ